MLEWYTVHGPVSAVSAGTRSATPGFDIVRTSGRQAKLKRPCDAFRYTIAPAHVIERRCKSADGFLCPDPGTGRPGPEAVVHRRAPEPGFHLAGMDRSVPLISHGRRSSPRPS